jgi:hypothetical protein
MMPLVEVSDRMQPPVVYMYRTVLYIQPTVFLLTYYIACPYPHLIIASAACFGIHLAVNGTDRVPCKRNSLPSCGTFR